MMRDPRVTPLSFECDSNQPEIRPSRAPPVESLTCISNTAFAGSLATLKRLPVEAFCGGGTSLLRACLGCSPSRLFPSELLLCLRAALVGEAD